MRIYISGAITSDPENYRAKFGRKAAELKAQGHDVINPAEVTDSLLFLDYDEFLRIDFLLIDMSDAIYMLSDWQNSKGAKLEIERAREKGKRIIYEFNNDYKDSGANGA